MKGGSVDLNIKSKVVNFLDCLKNCDRKHKENNDSKVVGKN